MKLLGWRTAAYSGFILGASGAAILAAALFAADNSVTARQSFYEAAAQILPILLLAHIVRLASIRDLIFAGRARRRQHMQSGQRLADRATALHTDVPTAAGDNVDLAQSFDQVSQELKQTLEALNRESEAADRTGGKLVEMIAGNLFATLILGLTGGAATLVDLAGGSDSPVIFVTTILALAWTGLGLLIFEILIFIVPPSLTSSQSVLSHPA